MRGVHVALPGLRQKSTRFRCVFSRASISPCPGHAPLARDRRFQPGPLAGQVTVFDKSLVVPSVQEKLSMSRAPSLDSLSQYLATLQGVPIFNIPLVYPTGEPIGNNGDRLIHLGAEQLFRAQNLTFVDDPDSAELIMMGGNGGMLEKFKLIPGLFREYWSRYPDKPLLVMPSTYYFPTESLTASLPVHSAEVQLFCRERVSYEHLRNEGHLSDCCRVDLSHDTAFALAGSSLIERYRGPGKHVLLVERDDAEHPSRFGASTTGRRKLRQFIPRSWKKPLYPLRALLASRKTTPFREKCELLIRENHPECKDLPRLVRDVSRPQFCSFEEFCQAVGDAELVFTTRLHVGILAALLGKRTYIFPGAYHKIRAIYEHSMTGFDNVTLVSWSDIQSGVQDA